MLGLHSSLGAASFSFSQAVSSRPKEYRLANGLEPPNYLWGRGLSLLALQRQNQFLFCRGQSSSVYFPV